MVIVRVLSVPISMAAPYVVLTVRVTTGIFEVDLPYNAEIGKSGVICFFGISGLEIRSVRLLYLFGLSGGGFLPVRARLISGESELLR